MAYPLDPDAQNNWLRALLGDKPRRGSASPDSFEVALLNGHPLAGGTELSSDGGYVRPVVTNNSTNFPDPTGGADVSAPIPIADPTDAWSDTAVYWLLIDAADSTTRYVYGLLAEELSIDGTETDIAIVLTIPWNLEA